MKKAVTGRVSLATDAESTKNDEKDETKLNMYDLQRGIATTASLFHEETHPTGVENEPVTARLSPICDHMKNLHIPENYQPSVLFYLLSGPTRDACDKMVVLYISLQQMIYEIKLKLLFNGDIQDGCINRWTSVEHSEFRRNTDNEEKATRICFFFMTKYQKDLPDYMCVPALL